MCVSPAGKGSAATLDALEQPVPEGRSRSLHYLGRVGVVSVWLARRSEVL
jgi:hypothetical protein